MATRAPVRFGILGCAGIAEKLIRAMLLLPHDVRITALGSRSLQKAQAFAARNALPPEARLYGSYEEVLGDPEVDAVYVPLPTGLHLEWVKKAASRGKHVLLEKPVAASVEEMEEFLRAVERSGVHFMDGTMFMHHPRTDKMRDAVKNLGVLDEVIAIFITDLAVTPGWTSDIRGQQHLDSLGCLGDIGWYCIRFILWAYSFELPVSVTAHPGSKLSDTGVLTSCGATFLWKDGRIGTMRTSFLGDMVMKGVCAGANGTLEVDDFVIPRKEDVATFLNGFLCGSSWFVSPCSIRICSQCIFILGATVEVGALLLIGWFVVSFLLVSAGMCIAICTGAASSCPFQCIELVLLGSLVPQSEVGMFSFGFLEHEV